MKQILLLCALIGLMCGCSRQPVISVTVGEQQGKPVFHLSYEHLNGLLGIRIWRPDTRDMLWHANLNHYKAPQLAYGTVPKGFSTFNGGKNDAQQVFPRDGTPPSPLPASARILVTLEIQYDKFAAASVTSHSFEFITDNQGRVSSVIPLASIRPDELPREPEPDKVIQR